MNKTSIRFLIIASMLIIMPIIWGDLHIKSIETKVSPNVPSDIEEFALEFLETASGESIDTRIYAYLAEPLQGASYLEKSIDDFRSFLWQSGSLPESKIVSYHYGETPSAEIHHLVYQVKAGSHYVPYAIQIAKANGTYTINSVDFSTIDQSLEDMYAFNLTHKSMTHYFVFTAAVLLLLFSIYTAALCFGTTPEHRWRRALFILAGIGTLTFNWTTGAITFNLISIAIPNVSINYGGIYVPYSLILHFPLGLILYWAKWRKETEIRDCK